MEILIYVALLIVGLFGVVYSSGKFLKAAEIIGLRLRLSPFVMGVVLVGFGTSLPELTTSLSASLSGVSNIAIPNILGSNLANILIILGVSSLFLGTIKFKNDLVSTDLPYLLGISILFAILISDGNLSLPDGLALTVGFLIYLLYTLIPKAVRTENRGLISVVKSLFKKQDSPKKPKKLPEDCSHIGRVTMVLVLAIIILALSSRLTVDSLLEIARIIDIQVEIVTFVTIAIGTSLPELFITFKALKQNQGDIVLGNIIGSSVFNILMVGGVSSLVLSQTVDLSILPWSIAGLLISAGLLCLACLKKKVDLWQGVVFLLLYVALVSKVAG